MKHTLLVTGATGRLGGRLLEALAERGGFSRIFALSRRPEAGPSPARAEFVRGDVTEAIPPELAGEVTAILHAAADTRFSAPLEMARAVNVEGTRNTLAFAARCPRLERFGFVSTVHVAGRRTGAILENELEHETGFVNAYEQSKYEAEQLVREHMGSLPIMVCRLSTVLGDARTGEVAGIGAVHQAVRFFFHSLAPMIPGEADSPVDLISSEYAVAAVSTLFEERFEAGRSFQVCAGEDALPLGELLELTRESFLCYRPAWRKRAIEMPAIVDLPTFELFVRSVEEVGATGLRQCVNAIKHFVPQMAYPKRFDDRDCLRALAPTGVVRPPLRDFYPLVVKHLIEPSTIGSEPLGAS